MPRVALVFEGAAVPQKWPGLTAEFINTQGWVSDFGIDVPSGQIPRPEIQPIRCVRASEARRGLGLASAHGLEDVHAEVAFVRERDLGDVAGLGGVVDELAEVQRPGDAARRESAPGARHVPQPRLMVVRSPWPDVSVPEVSITDYVLRHAERLRDVWVAVRHNLRAVLRQRRREAHS